MRLLDTLILLFCRRRRLILIDATPDAFRR